MIGCSRGCAPPVQQLHPPTELRAEARAAQVGNRALPMYYMLTFIESSPALCYDGGR